MGSSASSHCASNTTLLHKLCTREQTCTNPPCRSSQSGCRLQLHRVSCCTACSSGGCCCNRTRGPGCLHTLWWFRCRSCCCRERRERPPVPAVPARWSHQCCCGPRSSRWRRRQGAPYSCRWTGSAVLGETAVPDPNLPHTTLIPLSCQMNLHSDPLGYQDSDDDHNETTHLAVTPECELGGTVLMCLMLSSICMPMSVTIFQDVDCSEAAFMAVPGCSVSPAEVKDSSVAVGRRGERARGEGAWPRARSWREEGRLSPPYPPDTTCRGAPPKKGCCWPEKESPLPWNQHVTSVVLQSIDG